MHNPAYTCILHFPTGSYCAFDSSEYSSYLLCAELKQLLQIEKPLQRHGGRLDHNETYCGSCYGAEAVCIFPSTL